MLNTLIFSLSSSLAFRVLYSDCLYLAEISHFMYYKRWKIKTWMSHSEMNCILFLFIIDYPLYIKGIVHQKWKRADSLHTLRPSVVFLHQCLSNGCSAVNGCRQNESLIKTSQ